MDIELPYLEPYQRAVLDYHINNNKHKWIVTVSPRQVGKSVLLEVLLVYASLSEANSKSIAISPIFSQSRKLFDDVVSFAAPVIKKNNGSALEITFINGSSVKFASAEQGDHLRGYTCKNAGICLIDEAVWIKKDFFYDVVVPFTNVYGGNIFLFSTPRTKTGLFYELYTQGLNESATIKSFNWTNWDLSKFLTPSLLEMYRKQLPRITFKCEYLAQFADGQSTVFADFRHCIKNTALDYNKPITIGIDWGSGAGADYTVLTFSQNIDKQLVIPKQIAFNDKTPSDTIRFIVEEVKQLVHNKCKAIDIIVETNSIGAIYLSNLVEAIDVFETEFNAICDWRDEIEINCGRFVTTNQSKKKAVEQLELLFEADKIRILNDEQLVSQLSLFEAKVNKDTGTIQYAVFAPGQHDDRVMSLLFCVQRLYNDVVD